MVNPKAERSHARITIALSEEIVREARWSLGDRLMLEVSETGQVARLSRAPNGCGVTLYSPAGKEKTRQGGQGAGRIVIVPENPDVFLQTEGAHDVDTWEVDTQGRVSFLLPSKFKEAALRSR